MGHHTVRRPAVCAVFGAALFVSGQASAITVNDPFGTDGAAALGAPFHSVVRLDLADGSPLCTGSLIAPQAILTARHCTDGFLPEDITVSFTEGSGGVLLSRQVSGISALPGGFDYEGGDYDGSDVSVLSLWEAVTGFAPFRLLANPIVGEVVRMVGFGDQGLGSLGVTMVATGSRWAAENVVDAIVQFEPDTLIFTDFDDPTGTSNTLAGFGATSSPDMLPTEGTTAPGDSGGPLLFWREDEWVIGGVLSGGIGDASYGDISYWNGLAAPETRTLLTGFGAVYVAGPAVIPLPASGWLLLAGVAALAVRRRRGV